MSLFNKDRLLWNTVVTTSKIIVECPAILHNTTNRKTQLSTLPQPSSLDFDLEQTSLFSSFFTNWKMQRTKLNLKNSLVAVVQWTSEVGKIEVVSPARFSWPRVRPPSSGADGSWPSWRRSASGRRDSWEAVSPTGTIRRKRFSQRLWKSKKSLTHGAPRSQKKISLEHVFKLLNPVGLKQF